MKLENQVVSLELAKKLKSLNVPQESLFYWTENGEIEFELQWLDFTIEKRSSKVASAFTVAELGEMMKGKGMGVSAYSDIFKTWWLRGGEMKEDGSQYDHIEEAETEADARAKMLIYLIENKLI